MYNITELYNQVLSFTQKLETQLTLLERFKGPVNAKTISVRKDLKVMDQFLFYYNQNNMSQKFTGMTYAGRLGVSYEKVKKILMKHTISLL